LTVDGDLRFSSHHDMMRAVERIAGRAQLPLRFSQGFNPRPMMFLSLPKPVGVATKGDLLVIKLDSPMSAEDILKSMNAHAPPGMRFLRAEPLEEKKTPRPKQIVYELSLDDDRIEQVQRRRDELSARESWPVERLRTLKKRGKPAKMREIDLKPLVSEIRLQGSVLRMSLVPKGDSWARPGEILKLLGLDERIDLAATVRVALQFDM
jgi:radical SAM-linked protein